MEEEQELLITDEDLNEITRLILNGFTSGIVDSEGDRIVWSIKMEKLNN